MADVDQARAAWYRERAVESGERAAGWARAAACWPWIVDHETLAVCRAREAAHYALLAMSLEEQ